MKSTNPYQTGDVNYTAWEMGYKAAIADVYAVMKRVGMYDDEKPKGEAEGENDGL